MADTSRPRAQGAWAPRHGWQRTVGVASLIAVLVLLSGCGPAIVAWSNTTTVIVAQSDEHLAARASWDGQRITGYVRNKDRERIPCIRVEVSLLDRRGKRLSTVSATNPDGIAPGDRWELAIADASAPGATKMRLRTLRAC